MKCLKCSTDISSNSRFCGYCGNETETYTATTENSFINKISIKHKNNSSDLNNEKSTCFTFSAKTVYGAAIIFCVLLLTIVISSTMLFTASKYRVISDVEELISIGDYEKAEELSYTILYGKSELASYAEGALLRISGEYASKGKHNDAKRVLERLLSAKPDSFNGLTGYIVSSALAGDVMGAIKGISEVPKINAFVPNITSIVKDYSIGKISSANQVIELLLRGILNQN